METINIKGRNMYVVPCQICGKELHITKSKIATSSRKCTSCYTAERNRASKGNYRHTHNENYFSDMSLQSCYWAGFIAADGCISDKGTISIKINERDIERLETFIKDTEYDGVVLNSGSEDRKRVVITSHKWKEDLEKIYNIGARKSLTMIRPNKLTLEQSLAYIIGYIDGDGTIGYAGGTFRLGAIGTYDFLSWTKSIIDGIVTPSKASNMYQIKRQPLLYEYKIYGLRGIQIYNMLSQIPVTKMERKWNQVQK